MASSVGHDAPESSSPTKSRQRNEDRPGRRSRSPSPTATGVVDHLRCDACHEAIRHSVDHVRNDPCQHVVCTRCALRHHVARGTRPARCPVPSCRGTARHTTRCRYFSARVPGELLESAAAGADECHGQAPPVSRTTAATAEATRPERNGEIDADEPHSEVESNSEDEGDQNANRNGSTEHEGSAERSDVGLLSPHSMKIRQNACKLLLRQPHKKKERPPSSPRPASQPSSVRRQVAPDADARQPAKRRCARAGPARIQEEVAADLADIREAARDLARRAAASDGAALAAFERGLGAFSTGALRLWEEE